MDDTTANRSQRSQLFFSILSQHLSQTFPERAETIVQDIEHTARPIRAANQSRVVDEPSKHHLELTSMLLVSYRVLVPLMQDRDTILAWLRNVLAEPLQSQMQTYLTQRFGIDPTVPAQAFDAAAENFKQRGEQRFGKAFQYEQEVQTPEQSFVHIRRCFFNDFFRANGAPELTPLLWGHVYLEKGDIPKAIDTLEQAVEQAIQYRSRQVQSWFKTFLSEAYCADGQIEKAYDVARQALELAEDIKHPYGIGLAKRALGHITYASDNLAEAAASLREALTIFDAIQAQYYLARTHLDLTSLAHTQGNHDTATIHISAAYTWFKKLQVPKWVEKTEQLAQEYGVTLKEVELEELMEGDV